MSVTPQSVFASLSEGSRRDLLTRNNVPVTDALLEGDLDLPVSSANRSDLERDIKYIATLGADYSSQVLHEFLAEAGWTKEDFENSRSQRDRACHLLCQHEDEFFAALSIWNGNRLRGKVDRERGFRLPEALKTVAFEELNEEEIARLTGLIQVVLDDYYRGKAVGRVNVFERRATGLPTESASVIQCDIPLGDDPETIEIMEKGREGKITISRLSRISVIIDLGAGTLFVGTSLGKKAMHKSIAQVVTQVLFGDSTPPSKLSALKVFPERCSSKIHFSYSAQDGIEEPRIAELSYRLFSAPSSLQFRVRQENKAASLHDLEDVKAHAGRMRIWRAVVEFAFTHPDRDRPIYRAVNLVEPSGIAFGKAFPEERIVIERVLKNSGLIDPIFKWPQRAKLKDLERLIVPQHATELRDSWLPATVNALIDAGIVKQGTPHHRPWCRDCGETHPVERSRDDPSTWTVLCPVERRSCHPADLDTFVLSESGLTDWLAANACDDEVMPRRIGSDDSAWWLGRMRATKAGRSFDLIYSSSVDTPDSFARLNEFLLHRHGDGPGLVLTLPSMPVQKDFPHGWRVAALHRVLTLKKAGLSFHSGAASSLLRGRPEPKVRKTTEDWEEIFDLSLSMYPGNGPFRKYTVAREMIAAHPEICDIGDRQLADKLAERFPEKFLD